MVDKSEAVFTFGLRTPFGRAGKGAYSETRPDDLLSELFREQKRRVQLLSKANGALTPADVIVGCAYPEGEQGYNIARMAALGAGIESPATTVNRLCGSSLEAVAIAAARIRAGWGKTYLVGGIESMSRVPRRGVAFSESAKIREHVPEAYIGMIETAENIATRYPISRAEQEEFSAQSHEKAEEAYKNGFYEPMILPYKIAKDEGIRTPADRAKMATLKPVLNDSSKITAATSSPLSDGATSGWVLSKDLARQAGFEDALLIDAVTWSDVKPEVMGLGPILAVKKLLRQEGLSLRDIAMHEMNEAFAIQALACARELELPLETLNAWGGAIAIGHPLGASGLRLLMTLHHRLRIRGEDGARGIASLCIGGGQGMAVLVRYKKL